MEAKDTVKPEVSNPDEIYRYVHNLSMSELLDYIERTKLIQAEIIFLVGQQDQVAFDQLNFDAERLVFWGKIYQANQAGMQKVADFILDKNRAGGKYYHNGQWLKTFEFQLSEDECEKWGLK